MEEKPAAQSIAKCKKERRKKEKQCERCGGGSGGREGRVLCTCRNQNQELS
jgi:hypothetical protein